MRAIYKNKRHSLQPDVFEAIQLTKTGLNMYFNLPRQVGGSAICAAIINQQPGILSIDAIDDSDILLVLKTDLDKLYMAVSKLERLFRILAENSLATYQHRLIDNLSLSALERYTNFCQLYPSLIERLPQKQIASYIGVTPEFLSKMLRRVPDGK